jgi:hypothetical protein
MLRPQFRAQQTKLGRARRVVAIAAPLLLLAVLLWPVSAGSQQGAPAVARLYGDDVTVRGAVSFETRDGLSTALLSSGSDITVRTGKAQIELLSGGDIAICGPAHLTLLESNGAYTLALDYGQVRPQVEANVQLTVYTPLIVATPIAVGENSRDLTVGLDRQGQMCAVTSRGALRIEQQLTSQSVLLPQGGEVNLNEGELGTLRAASGSCDCELLVTRNTAPKRIELSTPAPVEAKRAQPAAPPPPPRTDQPIYRVDVPPLTFDANEPEPPPDPDPAHILLEREAPPLAQPTFAGHVVEPTLEAATDYAPPEPPKPAQVVVLAKAKAPVPTGKVRRPGFLGRIFGIFHHSREPCVGSGCGEIGN